jgi:hypothetical protein
MKTIHVNHDITMLVGYLLVGEGYHARLEPNPNS